MAWGSGWGWPYLPPQASRQLDYDDDMGASPAKSRMSERDEAFVFEDDEASVDGGAQAAIRGGQGLSLQRRIDSS